MAITRNIIGLTGNIATGKSVVRRMLVNHGALGLDADIIAHRTLYPGGKAFQPVIDVFGKNILTPSGEIDRKKLGQIVFQDPEQLAILESLTHPAVTEAIRERIERSDLPLIVIEVIKLFESPLIDLCNTVWVSQASPMFQLERLLQTRNMTKETAHQRIAAQPPQSEKRKRADVVINTEGPFQQTWQQVRQALNDTIQSNITSVEPYINISLKNDTLASPAGIVPEKTLEAFWKSKTDEERNKLYETLAFKQVQALFKTDEIQALLTTGDWNFTTTLEKVIAKEGKSLEIGALSEAWQITALKHQDEFLILPDTLLEILPEDIHPIKYGFEQRKASEMGFPAWQQAMERQTTKKDRPMWIKPIAQPLGFG
jgi:dephospho-CoA kinase